MPDVLNSSSLVDVVQQRFSRNGRVSGFALRLELFRRAATFENTGLHSQIIFCTHTHEHEHDGI